MATIAYIANQFPSPVEPYVMEEIRELRRRGVNVIPCSVRLPESSIDDDLRSFSVETLYLRPPRFGLSVSAAWLCLSRHKILGDLMKRAVLGGKEPPSRRMRTLVHTWLGAYYALLLQGRGVEHIHVHHGYFASWVAMVAARLLKISFSITLHGSDLLLDPRYLETKLKHCKFCVTVSDFNRQHILERYPECDPRKLLVQRLGVRLRETPGLVSENITPGSRIVMLAVGRLHPIKNHTFLLQACRQLKDRGLGFVCWIAGEGSERSTLERLIFQLGLQAEVHLLGHLRSPQLDACYANSNLVVLTSHSEGIPLALMEAMAHGKTVLAPAITGIPELVRDGETGFLYRPGSLEDFVSQVERIRKSLPALGPIRLAARRYVLEHFNCEKNAAAFGNNFLREIRGALDSNSYENPVLQQI
jgi:colanic acid/amylovoran biosynthesis glycosyltransferase